MAKVVVAGAILACSHQGRAQILSGTGRLTAGGRPAIVSGQEAGISFAPGSPGLLAPCPWATSAGPSPCTATLPAASGISVRLAAGPASVLLDTAAGSATNAGDPSATWAVSDPGQQKLTAAG